MCLRGLVRCVLSGNRKLSSQASLPAYPFTTVILGLDPRIHRPTRGMDGRVKPDHDDGGWRKIRRANDCQQHTLICTPAA